MLREWMRRLWGTIRGNPGDPDLERELALHLELAEEELRRQGHAPEEAARLARVRFGGSTQAMETLRDQRGFVWLGTCWLDVKLGLRMLRKYWGLTLVGGLAMTVAISVGGVVFAVFDTAFRGTLPLDDGDRVVAIQTWDDRGHRRHETLLSDLDRWRASLRAVEDIGAFQTVRRELSAPEGQPESVSVAEMTASGFQLARVPPVLGRPLVDEDERDTASPVLVIGYDAWQTRYGGDPAVVGTTQRLGGTVHTIVGVMPEGFAFPLNHHFWTALRPHTDVLADAGPEGVVFARLADGATLAGAQAELTTLGLLAVPEPDERLEPRVVPYTFAFTGDFERGDVRLMLALILVLVALLLVPPCINIAVLIYARTLARQEEFAARYALGASRGRIIGQLFIEVLVLATGAAGMALVVTNLALEAARGSVLRDLADGVPFWMSFRLSLSTLVVVAGLALLAALIAGLLPAVKATGGQMQEGLRALGSRTGPRLGLTWTALVVAQLGFSLAALPTAIEMGWGTLRPGVLGPGFPAETYLTTRLELDGGVSNGRAVSEADSRRLAARFGQMQEALVDLLRADPEVLGVTVAAAVPGQEPWARVEVEGVALPENGIFEGSDLVRFNRVDEAYFDVFDRSLLAGRGFDAGDLAPTSSAVVVNREFAQELLGDANPVGRRVRYLGQQSDDPAGSEAERWYEIVGVIENIRSTELRGIVYHPLRPDQQHPASLAVRTRSTPANVAPRLREMVAAVDLSLRAEQIQPLDAVFREQAIGNNLGASVLGVVTLSVLLLSAAGMYALMSFTVNQRRREIGIRAALGARPGRLLAGIFRRALGQLAVGAALGFLLALLLDYYLPVEQAGGWNLPGIVPAATAVMTGIGLLAAAGPARRGLRVDPTEALRDG